MDQPGIKPETYAQVLADLARVNRWTLAARPTIGFLKRALAGRRRFRLLDVGFGQGDMLRAIARWAKRRRISADLVGVDLNPKSLTAAQASTPSDLAIDFQIGDYRQVDGPVDIVVSSLVAHHMSEAEVRAFVRFMEEKATAGWLVNDLHRHPFAYRAYPALAHLLGVHRIVREDGTLSIARSFRPEEWRSILRDAGGAATAARVVRRFPFRLCVERLR